MFDFTRHSARGALAIVPAILIGSAAMAADPEIRAQTALPKHHALVKIFLDQFVAAANDRGKGTVQVTYIGGPEITPANRAASALQRGVIDMLQTPGGYYTGQVPHALALIATNKTVGEIRANGGYDILQRVWKEKLNAHIVAISETAAQYTLYFVKKPNFTKDGVPDLRGMKMRTTLAYRPFLNGLGASQVGVPAPEMYTALQRGVVDGMAWPNVALASFGVFPLLKYRIEPPFYHLANTLMMNLDRWNALPKRTRDFLTRHGAEYETSSNDKIAALVRADAGEHDKAGGQPIKLGDAAGKKYLKIAYDALWKRLGDTMSAAEVAEIKPKVYTE